eukprot:575765-Pyramimonas_sp.AAC.1
MTGRVHGNPFAPLLRRGHGYWLEPDNGTVHTTEHLASPVQLSTRRSTALRIAFPSSSARKEASRKWYGRVESEPTRTSTRFSVFMFNRFNLMVSSSVIQSSTAGTTRTHAEHILNTSTAAACAECAQRETVSRSSNVVGVGR